HCRTFGDGGDGYIPAEGVGVVVLKRLSEAKRDGDHIYGIIRGTALNHGGKTNGYTVPNPQAQASVISRALAESRTDARHISYIEAHGTGTKLGDPIEITALSKAFGKHTDASGFCLIGSAKSNIGHCESAAAVAGLTKVLLQMQHQQVVPSLHSAQLNPHIDFPRTPFVVNQELRPWEQPVVDGRTLPRIAGISSFGAGGSNAHMIVEEYAAPVRQPATSADVVVVLSARTAAQLEEKVRDLVAFLRPCLGTLDLPSLAWTLQIGREAMDERAAFVVGSNEELIAKLEAFLAGETAPYRGQVKRGSESVYSADADLQQTVDKWLAAGKLAKLADLWTNGVDLDWSKLYAGSTPSRISLPTYPFARERYWIEVASSTAAQSSVATAALHPLLHRNTSDLREQRYSSAFTEKSLSAAQYLEMARAAIEHSSPERRDTLELRDVIWVGETIVGEVHIALSGTDDAIDFEIYNGEVVLCQGRAVTAKGDAPRRIVGTPVQLPVVADDARYVLYPGLLDAALRAAAGSGEPFALDSLRIVAAANSGTTARVHGADVDLCDAQGELRVAIRGVRSEQPVVAQVAAQVAAPVVAEKVVTVERKKPAAISLHAPAAMSSDRPRPRPSITLSNPAATAPSPVPADDRVTIEITSIAQFREAIEKLRRDDAVKVVTLRGFERLDGYDEQLAQRLVSLPCVSIAVLQRETIGAGFLFAALCDFLVGSDDVRYGAGAIDRDVYPLLTQRFGHAGAQHLLLGSTGNGSIPAAQVETHAKALASSLAAKSRDALRLLKANLTRRTVTTAAPMVANAAEPQVFTFRQGMAVDRQVAQIAGVLEEGKPVVLASEYPDFLPHDVSEELVRELHRQIVASPVPVIAALDRDARGNGWLAAELCDATVYSDESVVSAALVSPIAATVFARRFGTDAASEILLTGDDYTVAGLQRRVGTLLTAKAEGVLEAALRVARMPWSASVRDSIRDLPATIGQAAGDVPPSVTAIALQSSVVTATVHPGGI
ncbi:MAG TPA: enoyl-CoA hydratase-related protein, partial [Thermoanaerobaculia bacterium]